ncbi:acyl-CoA dehydrogenase family protein [candidate division KSB1 bacterium]|nr:acyl-CoA dehydrogenase family protein [candidate division KSB1 bacterium]
MELTDKQTQFQQEMREFCEQEIEPNAAQIDRDGEFPADVINKVADRGLLGMVAPKEWGGLGLDTVSYAIAVEEISRACGSTGITVAAHNSLGVMPMVLFANDKQKNEYLALLCSGKDGLCSFGLTEPDAGSDAGATKTTGVRDGDDWIINGGKCFITNAGVCKALVITAKTQKIQGSRGISSFIIDRDTPGFVIGKKENKMGLRGSDTRELSFENVRLPATKMLGNEGEGFKQFMIILDGGRISIGAMALGLAQGAYDSCLKYIRENRKSLINSQAVQFQLADMHVKIQCARHLILHASRLEDANQTFSVESAMAKLYASEIGTEVARTAMQIVGPDAYSSELPLERIYRDVRLCEVGEGTSEIQRLVIARDIIKCDLS